MSTDWTTPDAPVTMTIEEFEQLPESDDYKEELVRGMLVREPRPGPYHGRTQARLAHKLESFLEQHPIGAAFTDVGVVISREMRTVRGPDVAYYSLERLPKPLPSRGFLEVLPDLAVEVVSPSNSLSDVLEKVTEYLDAGVRLVWVVDPRSHTATTYRSRDEIRIISNDDVLEGGDVLPGFAVELWKVLP